MSAIGKALGDGPCEHCEDEDNVCPAFCGCDCHEDNETESKAKDDIFRQLGPAEFEHYGGRVMTGQTDMWGMSAAETEEAEEAEFYRTPRPTVMQLLHTAVAIPSESGQHTDGLPGGLWVDAGAGDGALWSACRDHREDIEIVAVEKRRQGVKASKAHSQDRVQGLLVSDWLYPSAKVLRAVRAATVVVMNSAFSITHEFVQSAFDHCPNAWVWSLQRQSWGVPRGARSEWLMKHWPEFKLQCVGARPSFTGDGRTDPAEYDWYGWGPTGRDRTFARFEGPCREHAQGAMSTHPTTRPKCAG